MPRTHPRAKNNDHIIDALELYGSRQALAKALGVSPGAIGDWSNGSHKAPYWTVPAIAGLKAKKATDGFSIYIVVAENADSGEMLMNFLNNQMKGITCQKVR